MKALFCCEPSPTNTCCEPTVPPQGVGERPATSFVRHSIGIAGWTVPGVLLALMPKCPACLAAYVALGTGIGLSMSTASLLRTLLIVLCLASLGLLAARLLHRMLARGSLWQRSAR